MWDMILTAVAIILIIEGVVPLVSPQTCKKMMSSIAKLNNTTLRILGLVALILGVVILYLR